MFNMFQQLFTALTVLFSAFEKLASSTNHLATWADEAAGSFADEARVQRTAKLAALNTANGTQITQSTNFPTITE